MIACSAGLSAFDSTIAHNQQCIMAALIELLSNDTQSGKKLNNK
jgi:hypothetical protein